MCSSGVSGILAIPSRNERIPDQEPTEDQNTSRLGMQENGQDLQNLMCVFLLGAVGPEWLQTDMAQKAWCIQ